LIKVSSNINQSVSIDSPISKNKLKIKYFLRKIESKKKMEILDKGKHCQEKSCNRLDLLPIQCKACKKSFCSFHVKCEAHECKETSKIDYKIPVCQICNKTIEFDRNKDLNICLSEHMHKCYLNYLNNANQGKYFKEPEKEAKKCNYKKCKTKEIFQFKCDSCQLTFCTKHRVPEVHKCQEIKPPQLPNQGPFLNSRPIQESHLKPVTTYNNQNAYDDDEYYEVYEYTRVRFADTL
jgi:predicted nucleic acid binding AN1-type Zn finger protein